MYFAQYIHVVLNCLLTCLPETICPERKAVSWTDIEMKGRTRKKKEEKKKVDERVVEGGQTSRMVISGRCVRNLKSHRL